MKRYLMICMAALLLLAVAAGPGRAQDAQVSSGGQVLQPLGTAWTKLEAAKACTLSFPPAYPYGKFASQLECSLANTAHVGIAYIRWQSSLWGGTTTGAWAAWGNDSVVAAADTMTGVRMKCLAKHEYTNKVDWTWFYREIILNTGANDMWIRYKILVGAQF